MTDHIYAHEHPESDRARGGGFTLWFTGLSGSGKSTIAHLVGPELDRRGLVVEYLDDRVRSPEDIERTVGVPVLGIVPVFSAKRDA